MALLGYFFALIISFYLLAEVSDRFFIPSLDKIAKRFNMSHDMAGATLMAIGSSAPELFVAIISLALPGDHGIIGIGTIVGSALFNLLVIVGASAVVRAATLSWQPIVRDMLFYTLSIAALFFVWRDGFVTEFEAGLMILFYVVYVFAVVKWRKIFPYVDQDQIDEEETVDVELKTGWKRILIPLDIILEKFFPPTRYYFAMFAISIIIIAALCWVLVESAIGVSRIIHIPELIIALTVLAVGTSVPDMISSVIVAKQGRGGMAVSNAVGSNIFDILIGLGLPWLVYIIYTGGVLVGESEKGLDRSIIFLFISVLVVFFTFWIRKWKVGPGIGYFFIIAYLFYLIWELMDVYLI